MITIITAAHKSYESLVASYDDILPWLDRGFYWIIKDSGHCSRTVNFFATKKHDHIKFISNSDNGIYDALNVSVLNVSTQYYIVKGDSDIIYYQLLYDFFKGNNLSYDIYFFNVKFKDRIVTANPYIPRFVSLAGYMPSHSCATLIKVSLHNKLGLYSTEFKILSDMFFVSKAIGSGCKYKFVNECLGEFMVDGISSTNILQRIKEAYTINRLLGFNRLIQSLLFLLRIFRYKLNDLFKKI